MPSYGGESDSGFGGYEGGGFGGGYSGGGGGGLDGAPDIGSIGGNFSDPYGENSVTMGGYTSPEQSDANQGVNDMSWGYDFNAADMQAPDDFSLGQLFGYNSPQGLPTNQGEYSGNIGNYGATDFVASPFGKTLRGLLGMTPFGKVANMGLDVAMGKPLSQIAANAVPGQLGTVARAGLQAYNSPNPMASLGKSALGYGLGTVGGMIGGDIAGPVGGVLGGLAGSKMAGLANNAPAGSGPSSPSATQGGGGFNLGGALQGLGGLFAGYQGMKQAKQLQQNASQTNQALQTQMAGLNDMYSPNSAYAQQLAQQLARKDAASGRNSQYGPRAVELQARLAAMAPQVANSMATLGGAVNAGNNQALAANQAQQAAKAQMLNKLIGVGESSGFNKWAGEGLSSLFS